MVALAEVRAQQGRHGEADAAVPARGGARRAAGTHLLRAVPAAVRGDAAAAEREFREAERLAEPGWAFTLGRFLLDEGRPDEARDYLADRPRLRRPVRGRHPRRAGRRPQRRLAVGAQGILGVNRSPLARRTCAARRRGRGAGGRQGDAAASADAVGPQADAAHGRGAVPRPPARRGSDRPACAGWCWAPRTWPRRSPSTSATAPRSAWSSSTWSRTSRWAPAAASATCAEHLTTDDVLVFNGDVLSGTDLTRARRHPPRTRRRRHAAPGAGARPARVRLRADRRRRPGAGVPGEDRRTRRPTRSTPAATSSAAR